MSITESNIPKTFHYLQKGYIEDTNKALLDVINDLGNLTTGSGSGLSITGSDTGATVSSQPFTNGISTGFVNSAAGALILRSRDTPLFDTRLRTADGNAEIVMDGVAATMDLIAVNGVKSNGIEIILADGSVVGSQSVAQDFGAKGIKADQIISSTGGAIGIDAGLSQLSLISGANLAITTSGDLLINGNTGYSGTLANAITNGLRVVNGIIVN